MGIILKTRDEIETMRRAGHINALALEAMARAVRPGLATRDLDRIAADVLHAHGARPAFLGYPNAADPGHPYPATITV
ncbi:MAG: M24 family metallopeptidase, partial [Chloroflexota bacterium]